MVSRAFAGLVLLVPTVALGLGICAALYVLGGSAGLRPPPGLVAQESLGALGSEADEAGARIHSSVRTSAAGTGVVPVIVQIGDREEEVVALIRSVGGVVSHRFTVIPALAAEIPAGAVERVGAHEAVRWVSLDAPVILLGLISLSRQALRGGFKGVVDRRFVRG